MRFLNSLKLSMSVMYSNPASIRSVASLMLLAILHVHSSDWFVNVDCSMLMYVIVDSMLLCPSMVFTWIMSLVLWYSVVAFQCLNVWKCICLSLGLFSLVAVLLRSPSKVTLKLCLLGWNTLSLILGMLFSIAISLLLIGSILLLLPFSAVMYIVFLSESMFTHLVFAISPILAPVSLSICSSVAVFSVPADIRMSISASVGMNGSVFSSVYFGGVHVLPMCFR